MQHRIHALRALTMALLLAAACLPALTVEAAGAAGQKAFDAAEKTFAGKWWVLSEKEFGEFVEKYPESELRPLAILRWAQARFHRRNSTGAAELLSSNLHQAGTLADQYQFWMGEAYYQGSNYLAAVQAFETVLQRYPESQLVAMARYNEALAWSKLADWKQTIALLTAGLDTPPPAGTTNVPTELTVNTVLLLAEGHMVLGEFREAASVLLELLARPLSREQSWRVQYQLCRAQLAEGRIEQALQGTTNLIALAEAAAEPRLRADSVSFRASILEGAGRNDEAMRAYEQNLGVDVPADARWQALLKCIGLAISGGKVDLAMKRIETLLAEKPTPDVADKVLVALGELQLKEHLLSGTRTNEPSPDATGKPTNYLALAAASFGSVISNSPTGSLTGHAQLGRGWCLWLSGRPLESQAAFETAVRMLPMSEDQAVARFKWADAQYQMRDFAGALTNYRAVIEDYGSVPAVARTLVEPALYQTVRAGIEAGDNACATNAMARILDYYPDSFLVQGAVILVGESATRQGQPQEARALLGEFERRFPDSPLLPEVKLAVARSYEREKDWPAAIGVYGNWVQANTNHSLTPQVIYRQAWANYQAGRETNALTLLTNLLTQFPTNDAAALAQNWVGDFYFRQGDFKSAEENYQLLFQKWPGSPLAYPARMMAGRAAVARQGFQDAVGYFTALINDVKCPSNLVAQALFAYGDATTRLESADTNQPLANFEEAIKAFRKLQQLYPASDLVPLSWGRIGACYLQLAVRDAANYTNATGAFRRVLDDPKAGIGARSQAEVGLGLALIKQAALLPEAEQAEARQLALQRFLNVVYGKNLREGEIADPFWLKKAGLEAAKLAEDLQLWDQAVALYDYLILTLPQLTPTWESRKLRARGQLAVAKSE